MLIVFDGIDRAGKTTHLKMVTNWLKKEGKEFVLKREPGGTPIAEKIRSIFLNMEMDPIMQLLLLSACRYDLVKEFENHKDKLILCDRFVDSTYAYQGEYLDKQTINSVVQLTCTIKPDFVFLFLHTYGKSVNHMDEVAAKNRQGIIKRFKERAKLEPHKYFIVPNLYLKKQSQMIKDKIKDLLEKHEETHEVGAKNS